MSEQTIEFLLQWHAPVGKLGTSPGPTKHCVSAPLDQLLFSNLKYTMESLELLTDLRVMCSLLHINCASYQKLEAGGA